MGFVHAGGGEHAVVGGDERQTAGIGQRHHAGLDGAIDFQAVTV